MITLWTALLVLGGAAYLFLIGSAIIGLVRLSKNRVKPTSDAELPTVSLIIAARNEEANISDTLKSILAQDYPADLVEVVVVNDRSEDRTGEIVEQIILDDRRIKLINQDAYKSGFSPKKLALGAGIRASSGEVIVVTDADCTHDPNWITTLINCLQPDVGMVSGQARFIVKDGDPVWQKFQALDYQAQALLSAGLISVGMPFNCSGASLTYRRKLYDDVGGWEGVNHLISGDDELLMAKAHRKGWKVAAATTSAAVVRTLPVSTLRELWHQRIRWGSKGLHYHPSRVIVLFGIFLFYLMLTVSPLIWLNYGLVYWILIAFGLKYLLDGLVLLLGKRLFGDAVPWRTFLILELLHPLLVVLLAIGGSFSQYEWKGQNFKQRAKRDL